MLSEIERHLGETIGACCNAIDNLYEAKEVVKITMR